MSVEKEQANISVAGEEDGIDLKAELVGVPPSLQHMSEEELHEFEKKLKRKIDWRIIPMTMLMYILNYLDRNNIATARLGSLEKDLNMSSTQYQTAISILFVGYILMQIPSNMLLSKIGKPSMYLSGCMFIWAAISTCTAAAFNFSGLLAIRFFLGIVETAYFPGCLFLFSSWYTKEEVAFRTCITYSGSMFSGAFGGLLGAAIVDHMDGIGGLASWRWLFLLEGLATLVVVPFAYFVLPDLPANTKWLSDQERDMAMWRLRREVGKDDWVSSEEDSTIAGFKMAVKDIKVWISGIGLTFYAAAGAGIQNFFPSVVASLNYNTTNTLLLTVPPYMLCVIVTFANAYHSGKSGERYYHTIGGTIVALAAFIIACSTLNIGARYFSMMIMMPGVFCGFTILLTWVPKIIPRPASKRAVALAFVNAISNSSSIWSSYLYPSSSAPRYLLAFCCNAVFMVCALVCVTLLRFVVVNLNKKLDRGELDLEKEFGASDQNAAAYRTFRYPY
ncbi:hypothetical protein TRICI_005229 [Trichomonascus ciferrii]|uniref:Major facilitator superfamily (MFS) profile domain-containing protein n=1 Tax=Trichomonascus ciferrii TaxID=44093 RepID=A0A642UUY4_9ASCO|nr:hypothetical protein TRICI_005229 [Trichomonascus ciferrii]